MPVMLCMRAAFVKKNSCLFARIVLIDTAVLHLVTVNILEPYLTKEIELDFSHAVSL